MRGVAKSLLRPAAWLFATHLLATILAAQQANCVAPPIPASITTGTVCYGQQSSWTAGSTVINGSASVTLVTGTGGSIDMIPSFHATAGSAATTLHAWVDTLPSLLFVSPAVGSGLTQQFTWTVSSPSGYGYLTDLYILFATSVSANNPNSCYIRYNQPSNSLYLANNAGTGWSTGFAVTAVGASASNSQCTISSNGSSTSPLGTQLPLTVAVTFQPSFAGGKNNYLLAYDYSGLNSGWRSMGTWTVAGGGPTITSLVPSSGNVGNLITINGSNFGGSQGSSTVTFNGLSAGTGLPWGTTGTMIQANVPAGATTGPIVVTVGGVASSGISNFTVSPRITSLTPSSGAPGQTVTVNGANFGGAGTVTFNGAAVSSSNWTPTSFNITIPGTAVPGTASIVVAVGGLTSNSSTFTVTPTAPTITSLTPSSGPPLQTVTVNGANFGGSGTVTFNGVALSASNWTPTSFNITIPGTAVLGAASVVVTVGGVASNSSTFTVTSAPAPAITSLSTTSGGPGTPVTIAGTNFGTALGTVTFGGVSATVTSGNWSDLSIITSVPPGALSGNVIVTAGGVASNPKTFTVAPIITGVSSPVTVGLPVTISGLNFGSTQGTSTVAFNSTPAQVITWGPASIQVNAPNGQSPVVVTVGGLASNGWNITVSPMREYIRLGGRVIAIENVQ